MGDEHLTYILKTYHRIFGSKEKSLSLEELKARKEEENLFSELPQLPTILSTVKEVLDINDHTTPDSSNNLRID